MSYKPMLITVDLLIFSQFDELMEIMTSDSTTMKGRKVHPNEYKICFMIIHSTLVTPDKPSVVWVYQK